MDVVRVQRTVQVTRVRVDRQVIVSGGLQLGVPGVHDAVVHARAGRRRVAGPCPLFQIVEHRVAQISRLYAGLSHQVDDVGAFGSGRGGIVCVRIRIDAERDAQSFAFADIAQRILVKTVVPTVADADNRAFHAGVLGGLPVDLSLPLGNVDHAFGLLGKQCAVSFEEGRGVVERAPIGTILVTSQSGRTHGCRLTAGFLDFAGRLSRISDGLFDFTHLHGDEGFTVGFGQRIRLGVRRADQFLRRHRFAGFQALDLTLFANHQIR